MVNGGGYKKWFEKNDINLYENEILKCIDNYFISCQYIINEIAPEHFPDFNKYQKIAKEKKEKEGNNWNIEGCAIALYIQEHERIVMGKAYEFVTTQYNLQPMALKHDELILKGNVENQVKVDEISKFVKEKTDFDLEFKCEVIKATDEDKKLYEQHLPFVLETSFDNDFGLAKILYEKFQDQYVCVSIQEKWKWYEFDGNRWKECPKGASLKNHINIYLYDVICKKISSIAAKCAHAEDEERNRLQTTIEKLNKIAKNIRSNGRKNAILDECALLFQKPFKDFYEKLDTKPELIGFENGVFDLDTNTFRKGIPEDMISMTTKYDYTNVIDDKIRENIMHFFTSICRNEEEKDYLLTVIAYGLHGTKHLEEFFVLTGTGGNGKGVAATLCKHAFGDYYYSPDISMFTCKKVDSSRACPELAKSKGKRMLLSTEPDVDGKLQVGRLKQYTGNDDIQARELYKDTIEFKPQFMLMLQTNGIPSLSNFDGGIARRLRIIELIYKFVENPRLNHEKKLDTTLKKKFDSDVRYHQQFMLILMEYYNENVKGNKNKLITPPHVLEKTQNYLKTQDAVGEFIREYFDITDNMADQILSSELFNIFKSSEYGRDCILEKNKFSEQLEGLGLSKTGQNNIPRNKRGVFWVKLKEKQVEIQDDDL